MNIITIIESANYMVFDCDGVILQSNEIKTQAFRQALQSESSELVEQLVSYHKKHGGVTRQEKFRYFFEELKGGFVVKDIETACANFAAYCRDQLRNAALVPGIEEFLARIKSPCYLVTGGDQHEVQTVFVERNLSRHFKKILGSPTSKLENMLALRDQGFFHGRGIYFGDSLLDYELATEFGQTFCFVSGFTEWTDGWEFCIENNVLCVESFREILHHG